MPPSGPNPYSFLNVVKTALRHQSTGKLIAWFGIVLAATMLLLWSIAALVGIFSPQTTIWWWPESFGFVITACLALGALIASGGWGASMELERARGRHPDVAVDGVRAVLRILIVFALVTPFWSLFDQKSSTWIIQGQQMVMPTFSWLPDSIGSVLRNWFVSPSQMQALNPLLVMLLIPFNNLVLYPLLRKIGFNPTPLRRMGWGIAFSGVAWILAAMIQLWIDGGSDVPLAWQSLPYLLLTFGEVLVSATALEFAYSQAPHAMKGVIMAFWYLTSTFGSLWVLLTNAAVSNDAVTARIAATGYSENAVLMFFFAAFAFVAALAFALYARRYPMQDNYRIAG